MTIETHYELACDECGGYYVYDISWLTPPEIREKTEKEGWRRVDDMDYCPACRAKREGGEGMSLKDDMATVLEKYEAYKSGMDKLYGPSAEREELAKKFRATVQEITEGKK